MGIFLMILGVPSAIVGAYLIIVFLIMRFKDGVEEFEIQGFQNKKNKGRLLPYVQYETLEENEQKIVHQVAVCAIWNIGYLISPPIDREIIEISGARTSNPRVFGYLGLVLGVIALSPMLIALGLSADDTFFVSQMVYVLIMIAMVLGGWIALKLIQKS